MRNAFILTYQGLGYYREWFNGGNYNGYNFPLIDNGNQIGDVYYRTSRNIGCGGGWNLICDIAFNHLGLEKIIIGQDDAIFSQEILDSVWDNTNDDNICGTYDNGFTFSLFGITKGIFDKIGRFDENFIYACCEDNDYANRCILGNISISCLNVDHRLNKNISSLKMDNEIRKYNNEYLQLKWGSKSGDSIYGNLDLNSIYKTPFDNKIYPKFRNELNKEFPDIISFNKFPSEIEFELFKKQNNNEGIN